MSSFIETVSSMLFNNATVQSWLHGKVATMFTEMAASISSKASIYPMQTLLVVAVISAVSYAYSKLKMPEAHPQKDTTAAPKSTESEVKAALPLKTRAYNFLAWTLSPISNLLPTKKKETEPKKTETGEPKQQEKPTQVTPQATQPVPAATAAKAPATTPHVAAQPVPATAETDTLRAPSADETIVTMIKQPAKTDTPVTTSDAKPITFLRQLKQGVTNILWGNTADTQEPALEENDDDATYEHDGFNL